MTIIEGSGTSGTNKFPKGKVDVVPTNKSGSLFPFFSNTIYPNEETKGGIKYDKNVVENACLGEIDGYAKETTVIHDGTVIYEFRNNEESYEYKLLTGAKNQRRDRKTSFEFGYTAGDKKQFWYDDDFDGKFDSCSFEGVGLKGIDKDTDGIFDDYFAKSYNLKLQGKNAAGNTIWKSE